MSRGGGAIGLLNFRHFRSQTASTLRLRNIAASPLLTIPAVGWRSLRQGDDQRIEISRALGVGKEMAVESGAIGTGDDPAYKSGGGDTFAYQIPLTAMSSP